MKVTTLQTLIKSKQRCSHLVYNTDKKKWRKCKRYSTLGLCRQHWKSGNVGIYGDIEFGICCFCNRMCNSASQSCGCV